MKGSGVTAFNILVFGLYTLLLAGMQSTVWYQLFGHLTPPMLWILPCVYFSLYRSPLIAYLMTYVIAFCVAPFTIMPIGVLLLILIVLVTTGATLKRHIYWRGSIIFANLTFASVITFHIIYILFSFYFEERTSIQLSLFSRIFQAGLTYLVSFPLFYLFEFTDSIIGRSARQELELSQ